MTRTDSPAYKHADLYFKHQLDTMVKHFRADGQSWQTITQELFHRSAGEVSLTHETLRSWYADDIKAAT